MKKVILMAIVAVTCLTAAKAQKKDDEKSPPPYLSKVSLSANWEKSDSTHPGKTVELNGQGVYGHFAFDVTWARPFQNRQNWGLRDMKTVTLGYGFHKKIVIKNDYASNEESFFHLSVGIGPTLMLTPKVDSIKVKGANDLFVGGTAFANILNEETGIEGGAKLMYVFLPRNTDTTWNESVVLPSIELKKFFGKSFGVFAGYKMMLYTATEPQVRGRRYYGTNISQTMSEVSFGLCARFGKNTKYQLFAGMLIPREKFKMADNTNSQATNYFNAETGKTALKFGLAISFANPPDK